MGHLRHAVPRVDRVARTWRGDQALVPAPPAADGRPRPARPARGRRPGPGDDHRAACARRLPRSSALQLSEPALPARLRLLGHRLAHLVARGPLSIRRAAAPRCLPVDVRRRASSSAQPRPTTASTPRYLALPLQRGRARLAHHAQARAAAPPCCNTGADFGCSAAARARADAGAARGEPCMPRHWPRTLLPHLHAHPAPAIARGRDLAAGAQGRSAAGAGHRAVAAHDAAYQAGGPRCGLSQREELFARAFRGWTGAARRLQAAGRD